MTVEITRDRLLKENLVNQDGAEWVEIADGATGEDGEQLYNMTLHEGETPVIRVTDLSDDEAETVGSFALWISDLLHRAGALQASAPQRRWLTLDEAAALLGVSASNLRKLCREGKFPAKRVGRRWRIDRKELGL